MQKFLGFTLIEMMLTIVILGILLAIAAPNLSEYIAINRAKGFAENLAQDLVMARTEAIRSNQAVQLDVRTTCYGMKAGSTACNCTVTDISNSSYCTIKQISTSSGMSITKSSGFDNIIFDPVRGLPVSNTYNTLTATQVATIENSNAKITVNLNVIGSVCINSTAGTKKVSTYPATC